MQNLVNKFEKIISYILIWAVMAYIAFQAIVLGWETFRNYWERIKNVGFDYTQEYGKSVFIVFFNILLALEVLETIRVFNRDHDIKIRIILLVCIIAISRKILTMDVYQGHPLDEVALAALILGLSLGYYFVQKSSSNGNKIQDSKKNS